MPEALPPRLYSGSVKDVYGQEGVDPYIFRFSDRYSIFDWGEMPDSLEGKGEALAVMGDLFFRLLGRPWAGWQISDAYPKFWRDSLTTSPAWAALRRQGLAHHSLGLVDESLQPVAAGGRSNLLAVKALGRPPAISSASAGKVHWDYSAYHTRPANCLVPLEVVFRFGAPEGSSFLERLAKWPGYAQSFGFPEKPAPGEWFPFPVVEFFTKLEPTDRFLSREEAASMAALSQDELDDLVALTLLLALRLKDVFSPMGLALWDGKFEFAFVPGEEGRRSFLLVDSIGPDELRLLGPDGVHFSKEFLRRAYRGSTWYEAVGKAKELAAAKGQKDWKRICRDDLKEEPSPLPERPLACARLLYPVLAETLAREAGLSVYRDLPSVTELCRRMKEAV
jgi:phosphoribosylaminoimidazole-succinocarboxamide synthase